MPYWLKTDLAAWYNSCNLKTLIASGQTLFAKHKSEVYDAKLLPLNNKTLKCIKIKKIHITKTKVESCSVENDENMSDCACLQFMVEMAILRRKHFRLLLIFNQFVAEHLYCFSGLLYLQNYLYHLFHAIKSLSWSGILDVFYSHSFGPIMKVWSFVDILAAEQLAYFCNVVIQFCFWAID